MLVCKAIETCGDQRELKGAIENALEMITDSQNKKFFFGQVKQGARMKDFKAAIQWLMTRSAPMVTSAKPIFPGRSKRSPQTP